jgi:hypothetical protein
MTLVAAVVLPSAPLLLPGASARPPAATDAIRAAIDQALAGLPPHDLRVLLAGAAAPDEAGVRTAGRADLGGLSRPDLSVTLQTAQGAADDAAAATGLTPRGGELPVDLAVLALQAARAGVAGTLAVALPWTDGATLTGIGERLIAALPAAARAVVVAAGDLSAGLGAKSPRPGAADGAAWNEAAVAALHAGDAHALAALGPGAAGDAVARGWPALTALLGALGSAGLRLTVRCTDAPRGVGYVVAGA